LIVRKRLARARLILGKRADEHRLVFRDRASSGRRRAERRAEAKQRQQQEKRCNSGDGDELRPAFALSDALVFDLSQTLLARSLIQRNAADNRAAMVAIKMRRGERDEGARLTVRPTRMPLKVLIEF
jgi:hypothetical protein